ncbi:FadR/GntR family transcriptional regulator [Planococcus shenhongbingii]|uniref:FadR/GntR family transcriptional regulator n=1 Tax=Planococcus shenhongbingii TaxID=3058398 RepID=A0ABT8NGZ2_9BACL|nr:FadR/GntR family transcriptional regulator [Planococcus sp. N017]MDN7247166.1 FadR/GntR family transcriptional regulator [Planococcus sp. N017]
MFTQSRSEQLVEDYGRKIVKGEIVPGEKLPKVEDISEAFGVSRTVVREALKGLSSRKLIKSYQKVGTTVLPPSEWQWWDIDVLTWSCELEESGEFLKHMTEVRLGIEPTAAAIAAARGTEEDFQYIYSCYQKLEEAFGDEKIWAEADYDFHKSIMMAAHNPLMSNIVQLLRKALMNSREKTVTAIQDTQENEYTSPKEEVLKRHWEVYEAIRDRDGMKAHQKMEGLILRVNQLLHHIYKDKRLS